MSEKVLGKPEPDSDVVNKQPKVLLIGVGWLGQHVLEYFTDADMYNTSGFLRKKYEQYDLAVIGVPTPMNSETGQCDTSIVENCVDKFKDIVDHFLIKSTVEIGTTDRLKEKYKVKIAMSPEFLGESLGHPLIEPRRDVFQIIGGEDKVAGKIAGFWRDVLNANAPIMIVSAVEAEIIKYCENYWIMQRVDFWNDVYDICETLGGEFTKVREGLVLDPRLNRTHSNVYPNNRGWSSKCLPKDPNALAYTMRKMGKPLTTLEHQLEKNMNYWRKDYVSHNKLIPDKPLWRKNNV